jgi:glycine/D-amino acid oxidase-like deaminating enzyme
MGSFPTSAKVVIVGAGIVGNSLAYHLANLGWRDILLIDKGPLPNPGGSTGHASNFLYRSRAPASTRTGASTRSAAASRSRAPRRG